MRAAAIKQERIVLTCSPLEAATGTPTMHQVNPADSLSTLCGMKCEGWRMTYGRSEQPIDEKQISCTQCRKSRRARSRGDSNSRKQ